MASLQFGVGPLQWLLTHAIFPGVKVSDLYLHPIARAAWVGMFMTAMNLLPIGQLDGGHILYSFFPRRHKLVSKLLCVAMLPLGVFWYGWAFWGAVLLLSGPAPSFDLRRRRSRVRTARLGWIALAVFLLCFSYAPIVNRRLLKRDEDHGHDHHAQRGAQYRARHREPAMLRRDSDSGQRLNRPYRGTGGKPGRARLRGRLARICRAEELGSRTGLATIGFCRWMPTRPSARRSKPRSGI